MTGNREQSEPLEALVRRVRAGTAPGTPGGAPAGGGSAKAGSGGSGGSGGEDAFEALVRAVRPRIHRWALTRVGGADDADDVTQAVLLRLHRSLGEFEGRSRFTSWLYRVTMNEATDHMRARGARERMREGAAAEPRPPEQPPGVERVTDARLAGLVRAFFRELPDRQRQIFDLVDLQGLEPSEVAEMLEMNRSTVRANLFKARRAIRERILEGHPALAEDYGGGP